LWAQFNHVTIVVYPDSLAGELDDVLGLQSAPEEMWQAAADRARSALVADEDDAFAWFGLGASLFHMATLNGDDTLFAQAAAAFDRAREIGLPWRTLWYQFEPYQAYLAAGRFDEVLALTEAVMTTSGGRNIEETHLYRGHALLASGDPDGAQREYERALRLNPGSDAAEVALQTLTQTENGGAG
jgi:tetratricopeptide (TPR) repeat protein